LAALVESKACIVFEKSYAAVFHMKCFDLYRAAAAEDPEATAESRWWPLLVSSEPVGEAARRVCVDLGIVLSDPSRMPLPALLYAASRPHADDYLPEAELGELVRLGERACVPMQSRWRIDGQPRTVTANLDHLSANDVGDLLFLQDELTQDFLDTFEVNQPGLIERRAAQLSGRLQALSMAI
jgi:hypothetical protein